MRLPKRLAPTHIASARNRFRSFDYLIMTIH